MGPVQEIANLKRAPGELSFDARIGGGSQRVWLRGGEVTPPADAALALGLMPAMCEGRKLRLDGDLSPRVHRMHPEFQAMQAAWSRGWSWREQPLRPVEVEAATRDAPSPRRGRVAAFFSGGVDSWATVLSEPDVTDLIFVRGLDIVPAFLPHHQGLGDRVESVLREMASELGMQLHVVETNVREMSEPLIDWYAFHASVLSAIGLYFESRFERVLIPTDNDHATNPTAASGFMIDGLWSSEAVEIVDHGSLLTRFERTRLIAGDERVRNSLRVCYENPDGAYNCGRCNKCTMTMMTLEALGVRDRFPTFPPDLDLSSLEEFTPTMPIQQVLRVELMEECRARGREDLVRALEPAVARGDRAFANPQLLAAREDAEAARAEAAAARAQLQEVLGSTSWRLTAPLRRLRSLLR